MADEGIAEPQSRASRPELRTGNVRAAVAELRVDGGIAFPTETVWGLAVSARSEKAVANLFRWKGRSDRQPMAVLVSALDRLGDLGAELDDADRALLERFWPGPLTVVLRSRKRFASGVARADGAIGVRCSFHPLAMALAAAAEAAGIAPITATSLNRSGDSPAETVAAARSLLESWAGSGGQWSPLLLTEAGPDAEGGEPSTVLDLTGEKPEVLRWGALGRDVLGPELDR